MTDPSNITSQHPLRFITNAWRSWWKLPVVYVILGTIILAAEASTGNLERGSIWFTIMAAIAAFYTFGGRFELIRQARGDFTDERDASIQQRALAGTGVVLVVVLTGCIAFELARGENPSPYTQLMAIGGGAYIAGLFVNRYRP